jgi:hypothetical protein
MFREVVLLCVGMALLGAAVYLVHTRVTAIKVGEHTSRLVGIVCAIVAYYYFRHSFSLRMPTGQWNAAKLMEVTRIWAAPVILLGAVGYYAITIFRNWRSEFIELVSSTLWIAVVAALIIAARYVLAQ